MRARTSQAQSVCVLVVVSVCCVYDCSSARAIDSEQHFACLPATGVGGGIGKAAPLVFRLMASEHGGCQKFAGASRLLVGVWRALGFVPKGVLGVVSLRHPCRAAAEYPPGRLGRLLVDSTPRRAQVKVERERALGRGLSVCPSFRLSVHLLA